MSWAISPLDHVKNFLMKHITCFSPFLLLLNYIYRVYHKLWATIGHLRKSFLPHQTLSHDQKRRCIEEQVKDWRVLYGSGSGRKKKMCTARPKSDSMMVRNPKYRDTLHAIRLNDLTEILSIDPDRRVVKVEPMVTMAKLTGTLMPLGWTLPVIPEMGQLTVGGLVMGGGLQTSSHKYGMFHRNCRSFEIVLSSGNTVVCSKDENSELFQGIPFSYGSLGFLTAVELDMIEAKPGSMNGIVFDRFVQLDYHPVQSFEAGLSLIEAESKNTSNDFVEGILFSKDKWVVMTGKMVEKTKVEGGKVSRFGPWYKPWFFKHVESFMKNGNFGPSNNKGRDYVPLIDYYYRHDRCTFWVSWPLYPYGNHPLFRFLFGWALPLDIGFVKTMNIQFFQDMFLLQDLLIPAQAVEETIIESERQTGLYPIWICPMAIQAGEVVFNSDRERTEMFFDIGVYGMTKVKNFNNRRATRKLEALMTKHKGIQGLYTDVYMTREEFRATYDMRLNDLLRKKYEAEHAFPDIYSKISFKGRMEGL